MKRFLTYTAFFFIFTLTTLVVIEILVRHIPNAYKLKNEQLINRQDSLEILVLGSSYAYMGIDPHYFTSPAFNAANVSQTFKYDNYIAEKYIPHMPKLKHVILPVSYFTFFLSLKDSEEWFREISYTLYMDYNEYGIFSKQRYEVSNPSVATSKLTDYYLKHADLSQSTEDGMSTAYYLKNKPAHWDLGEERAKSHKSKDMDGETYKQNVAYLDHIAHITAERNINLILITTPACKSYSANVDKAQLSKMRNTVQGFVDKYDHIRYFDFFTDSTYVDDDFYDSDHLTELGARKLTTKLDSILHR